MRLTAEQIYALSDLAPGENDVLSILPVERPVPDLDLGFDDGAPDVVAVQALHTDERVSQRWRVWLFPDGTWRTAP